MISPPQLMCIGHEAERSARSIRHSAFSTINALDFGMTACPPDSSVKVKLLERVQAKATALVHGLRGFDAKERRKKLGLMMLEERRERSYKD